MHPYTTDGPIATIYTTAKEWEERCLFGNSSLLFPEKAGVWTSDNVSKLDQVFNGSPIAESGKFVPKLESQLSAVSDEVRIVAADLLVIYYLTPHFTVVGADRKWEVIRAALGAETGLAQSTPPSTITTALKVSPFLPGRNYLQGIFEHYGFLIDFVKRAKSLQPDELRATLDDPVQLSAFADETTHVTLGARNMLLHYLDPRNFVSVAADNTRRELLSAFNQFIANPEADTDAQLRQIVDELEKIPAATVDGEVRFFEPPLSNVWLTDNDSGVGELEALDWKKNICLFGPPGTGKSFTAGRIAERLIRRQALARWGAKAYFENEDAVRALLVHNIHLLQLHQAWDYASFVVGLVLEGNETVWKPGKIFEILDAIEEQPRPPELTKLPTVVVLDEVNRTDLSAMLGEMFTLLERDKRGEENARELPTQGQATVPPKLWLPEDFFLIATMNDIDQSVETLDFALRRRFLWRRCDFDRSDLMEIIRSRWAEQQPRYGGAAKRTRFGDAEQSFARLADRAEALNQAITEVRGLGAQFRLGHAYFGDIVELVLTWLSGRSNRTTEILWTKKGQPQPPAVSLWDLSLEPLLEQYVAGIEDSVTELTKLKDVFLRPA